MKKYIVVLSAITAVWATQSFAQNGENLDKIVEKQVKQHNREIQEARQEVKITYKANTEKTVFTIFADGNYACTVTSKNITDKPQDVPCYDSKGAPDDDHKVLTYTTKVSSGAIRVHFVYHQTGDINALGVAAADISIPQKKQKTEEKGPSQFEKYQQSPDHKDVGKI